MYNFTPTLVLNLACNSAVLDFNIINKKSNDSLLKIDQLGIKISNNFNNKLTNEIIKKKQL